MMCLEQEPRLVRKRERLISNNPKSEMHRIYIDPEDTVTDVRERLTHLPFQSVAIVVPQRTQLHYTVAWKLLARCAQELEKEIVIVSSDRQIRALARSVHFALVPDEPPSESTP